MYESIILLFKFKGKKVWKHVLALRIKYSHNWRTRLSTELCKFVQNPLNSAAQIYPSSSLFSSLLTFVQNPLNSAAQIYLSSSSLFIASAESTEFCCTNLSVHWIFPHKSICYLSFSSLLMQNPLNSTVQIYLSSSSFSSLLTFGTCYLLWIRQSCSL
jgi:hypothetical protein